MRINKGFVGLLRKKYVADTDFNELQVIKVYFCKNVSFEQKKQTILSLCLFLGVVCSGNSIWKCWSKLLMIVG